MQKHDNTEPSETFFYSYDPSGLLVGPRASNDESSQGEVMSWDGWAGDTFAVADSCHGPDGKPIPDSTLYRTPSHCQDATEGRWLELPPMACAPEDANLYRYPAAAVLPAPE
jgi:hypothetical protein